MRRRAFTLIELLVVISIIGLLSTIAVVSLGAARSQSRNAKRGADIKQYATAFDLAYSNTGAYPASGNACISLSCYAGWSGQSAVPAVDAFFSPYISPKPTDPAAGGRPNGGYLYNGSWAGGTGLDGVFSAGPMLDYTLEGAVSCPLGRRWYANSTATECVYSLPI